ncbi:MAG: transposase [Myxococcaceae bacterium]|nr:transposase [Myxococcaceae bacterium]
MLKMCGKTKGIALVDSTTLRVCHNKRIHRNRVFGELGKRSKSTMGWFFGFKLHLIINDCGEILAFRLTQGNVDDRKLLSSMASRLHDSWAFLAEVLPVFIGPR